VTVAPSPGAMVNRRGLGLAPDASAVVVVEAVATVEDDVVV